MAECANIEFERDVVSKPDSNNNSRHDVTHSENKTIYQRNHFSN